MSFKSLFADTAPKQTKRQKREAQVAREIEAGGQALAAAVTGPVAIQYGAEAVLNSLTARPAAKHKGQTFEQFVSDVAARHPSKAPVAVTTRRPRGPKYIPVPCREKCGRMAHKGSDKCQVCADRGEMQGFVARVMKQAQKCEERGDLAGARAALESIPREERVYETDHERARDMMREVMQTIPLSTILETIELGLGQMPTELVDCKFRRAK